LAGQKKKGETIVPLLNDREGGGKRKREKAIMEKKSPNSQELFQVFAQVQEGEERRTKNWKNEMHKRVRKVKPEPAQETARNHSKRRECKCSCSDHRVKKRKNQVRWKSRAKGVEAA